MSVNWVALLIRPSSQLNPHCFQHALPTWIRSTLIQPVLKIILSNSYHEFLFPPIFSLFPKFVKSRSIQSKVKCRMARNRITSILRAYNNVLHRQVPCLKSLFRSRDAGNNLLKVVQKNVLQNYNIFSLHVVSQQEKRMATCP